MGVAAGASIGAFIVGAVAASKAGDANSSANSALTSANAATSAATAATTAATAATTEATAVGTDLDELIIGLCEAQVIPSPGADSCA